MSRPGPTVALSAEGLTKHYTGRTALNAVSLELPQGSSLAVFGPNGAGKTTLIRVLTLGLRPNSGRFKVAGCDPRRQAEQIRRKIGVISHKSYLYDDLSVGQNLTLFAQLYGVRDVSQRVGTLLDAVELTARQDDPVRSLSRGLRQRASVARALVHDPQIVFLDEPFTGLDPHAAGLLRTQLESLRSRGRTVFLVTHNLNEGLSLCDRWLVLSRGKIVGTGDTAATTRQDFERRYFELVTHQRRAQQRSSRTDLRGA